jgi:hypothetical protein
MAVPVDMKELAMILGLIAGLGLLLMIYQRLSLSEGFASPTRCGVDYGPCPFGQKCINGFCAVTEPCPVREKDPVPLLPEGGPAPYF